MGFYQEFITSLSGFGIGCVVGKKFAIRIRLPDYQDPDHQDVVSGTITGLAVTDLTIKLETSIVNLCPFHRLVCLVVRKNRSGPGHWEAVCERVFEKGPNVRNSVLVEIAWI